MSDNVRAKKFDRKHLIKVLQALQENYVFMIFSDIDKDVIVQDTKTKITIHTK